MKKTFVWTAALILVCSCVIAGCREEKQPVRYTGEKSGRTYTLECGTAPVYDGVTLTPKPLSNDTVEKLKNELSWKDGDIFDIQQEMDLYYLYFSRQITPDAAVPEEESFMAYADMTPEKVEAKAAEFLEKAGITPEGEYGVFTQTGDRQQYCVVTYFPLIMGVPVLYAPRIELSFSSRQIEGFTYSWAVAEQGGEAYNTDAICSAEEAVRLFEDQMEREERPPFSTAYEPAEYLRQVYWMISDGSEGGYAIRPAWVFYLGSLTEGDLRWVDAVTKEVN